MTWSIFYKIKTLKRSHEKLTNTSLLLEFIASNGNKVGIGVRSHEFGADLVLDGIKKRHGRELLDFVKY